VNHYLVIYESKRAFYSASSGEDGNEDQRKACKGAYDLRRVERIDLERGSKIFFVTFRFYDKKVKFTALDNEAALNWAISIRERSGLLLRHQQEAEAEAKSVEGDLKLWHLDPLLRNSHQDWRSMDRMNTTSFE